MKVILNKAVVVVTIGMMAMLQSCSSNDDLDGYTPTNFNVGGKVEKGPFVRGTAIQMQPLDADLDETGESFTSTITDNEGTFTFGSKLLKSPYVKLSASGYYFNEVTGELSKGTLALNAVANLQNAADVNLNILSHLKYQRVKRLPLRILSIISIGMEMEPQEMKLRLKIILSVWKQIISMYLWKVEAMR